MKKVICLLITLLACAVPTFAAEDTSWLTSGALFAGEGKEGITEKKLLIAPKVGTMGYGAEIGYRLNEDAGVRVSGTYLSLPVPVPSDISLTAEMFSLALLADWYPFRDNFRFTAGLAHNDIVAKGKATDSFDINDTEYTGRVDARVYYENPVAPYLGLGGTLRFGGEKNDRMGLFYDFGWMYLGETDVIVATSIPGNNVDREQLNADIDAAKDEIRQNLPTWYPVLNLGFAIYF